MKDAKLLKLNEKRFPKLKQKLEQPVANTAITAAAPIIGSDNSMTNHNLITAGYLRLLEWFASFLVWFAESLESLFGPEVRNGIFSSPAPRKQDALDEFDSANSSLPTVNVFESSESNGFSSVSRSSIAFNSPNEVDDRLTPCCGHVPLSVPNPNTANDIKPFDPYDPQDPNSVFNGDPLNFDPAFHSDPFGNS